MISVRQFCFNPPLLVVLIRSELDLMLRVKCLLCKHEDVNSDPQYPPKSWTQQHGSVIPVCDEDTETNRSEGSLAYQCSQSSKF